MAHIHIIPEDQAEGELKQMYQKFNSRMGFVPNFVKVYSLRPEAYTAWGNFLKVLRGKMRMRQYELVVIAAVSAIGCHY